MSKIIKDIMKKRKAIVKQTDETKEIIKALETMQNAGMEIEPYLAKLEKDSPEVYASIEKQLEVEVDPKDLKDPKKKLDKEKEDKKESKEDGVLDKLAKVLEKANALGDKDPEEKPAQYHD